MKKLFACLAIISAPLAVSLLTIGLPKAVLVVIFLIPLTPLVATVIGLAFLLISLFLGIDATTSVLLGL